MRRKAFFSLNPVETDIQDQEAEHNTARESLIEQGFTIYRAFTAKKPYLFIDMNHRRWAIAADEFAKPVIYRFEDVLDCRIWENDIKNCNSLKVYITVNDVENPLITLNLITFSTARDSFVYKNEVEYAQKIVSVFTIMMHRQPSASPAAPESIPSQVRQLAELKAQGILTEEEFKCLKTKVIDLAP